MKLIDLADIHHAEEKWGQLVDVARQQKPDVVAIAGDFMPKTSGTLAQFDYLPHIKEWARKIRDVGPEIVLVLVMTIISYWFRSLKVAQGKGRTLSG